MFAGAQIGSVLGRIVVESAVMFRLVTTKLVPHGSRKQTIDAPSEDRTTQDLINMIKTVPRSKAAIVVETRAEKIERKLLAQKRRQERLIEQQKIAQQMEHLMERVISGRRRHFPVDGNVLQVLRETPLPKKDEIHLRQKIRSIVTKVNKDVDRSDIASVHPSLIEPTSSTSQIVFDVNLLDPLVFLLRTSTKKC